MGKKIIRKPYINKKTGQLSITIPKRKIKAIEPSVKFNDGLSVELRILYKKKNKKRKNG